MNNLTSFPMKHFNVQIPFFKKNKMKHSPPKGEYETHPNILLRAYFLFSVTIITKAFGDLIMWQLC